MLLHVNPNSELPIYRQIERQISDAIAGEYVKVGDRLPSHRELAAELVIAPLTVKKAYDELERVGLIRTERGRGTFVAPSRRGQTRREARERLRDTAQRLVVQARLGGVVRTELQELIDETWEEVEP